MTKFAKFDTAQSNGVYVAFDMVVTPDEHARASDYEDGVFPADQEFFGIQAKATVMIIKNGTGTYYTLTSPGIWAVDQESGDYVDELYKEEVETLKADIAALSSGPIQFR